jgi:hypothetical protein
MENSKIEEIIKNNLTEAEQIEGQRPGTAFFVRVYICLQLSKPSLLELELARY